MSNQTLVTEFPLQGFSEVPQLQVLVFVLFLGRCTTALCGNSLIVVAITFSSRLHTPMYFFLVSLRVLDIICAGAVVPKLLEILVAEKRSISYRGCVAQTCFPSWSVAGEVLLFTAVAYDRRAATCQPLLYSSMMGPRVCAALAGAVWGISTLRAGVNACPTLRPNFCGPNVMDHFFCEIPPLLLLSCSSTYVNDIMAIMADIFFVRTAEGKQRAFSTCSSHLIVVTLYYCTITYTYLSPGSSYSPGMGKVMAVLYSTASPTLNPLIYSLKNKDIKAALKKVLILCKRLVLGFFKPPTVHIHACVCAHRVV
uniref:G-protein coupled receptors family 1 profile domain-containing protein n=1 Tax=Ailuropoda melanoleuca TaxID=9646 RepID=A0A7N5JCB9_AILME